MSAFVLHKNKNQGVKMMERKLTQEEFVQLFALRQQRTKKAKEKNRRQNKNEGYNFWRQESHYGLRISQIC
jgi:hypothetical protein